MRIRPFQGVGAEIIDVNISTITELELAEVREIFRDQLLVVFRNQPVLTVPFAKLVCSVGKGIANAGQCLWDRYGERIEAQMSLNPFTWAHEDEKFPVQRVTGMKKNGRPTGIFGQGKLDWHSNMNGPFNRAAGVALQGVEGVEGTSTSWMDTTAAFRDLSDELRERCKNVVGRFEYSPEIWAEGLLKEQYDSMVKNKEAYYEMPLVNYSALNKPGLYLHYHNKCSFPSDPDLLGVLKGHCFQSKYIHTLDWEPGDIHLSDQVLTLHKRNLDSETRLEVRVLHRYTFHYENPNYTCQPIKQGRF